MVRFRPIEVKEVKRIPIFADSTREVAGLATLLTEKGLRRDHHAGVFGHKEPYQPPRHVWMKSANGALGKLKEGTKPVWFYR